MNNESARYRRALKKHLHCGGKTRRQLLKQFDKSLDAFQEDQSAPTRVQLESAFGPPEAMAAVLMEGVSEAEQARYLRNKKILRILAGIAAALFIAYSIYIFYFKEIAVYQSYDDVIPGYAITATESE